MPDLPPDTLSLLSQAAAPIVSPVGNVVADVLTGLAERALRTLRLRVHEWREIDRRLFADVNERLAKRGVTQPTEPDPAVGFGAVEGARTTSDDLHSLFAELLTTAMDPATAESAHPAFPPIIRQLVGDEAKMMTGLAEWGGRFLLKASTTWGPDRITASGSYLPALGLHSPARLPSYKGNLVRLGLIEQRVRVWMGKDLNVFDELSKKLKADEPFDTTDESDIPVPDIGGLLGSRQAAAWALTRARLGPGQYPHWMMLPEVEQARSQRTPTGFVIDVLEATPLGVQFIIACIGPIATESPLVRHSPSDWDDT